MTLHIIYNVYYAFELYDYLFIYYALYWENIIRAVMTHAYMVFFFHTLNISSLEEIFSCRHENVFSLIYIKTLVFHIFSMIYIYTRLFRGMSLFSATPHYHWKHLEIGFHWMGTYNRRQRKRHGTCHIIWKWKCPQACLRHYWARDYSSSYDIREWRPLLNERHAIECQFILFLCHYCFVNTTKRKEELRKQVNRRDEVIYKKETEHYAYEYH